MHNPHADVAPGSVDGVWVAVTQLGQSEGHSVEDGWLQRQAMLAEAHATKLNHIKTYLLVEVVVVVRNLADANWELGVHVLSNGLRGWVHVVLGVGERWKALGVPESLSKDILSDFGP